MKKRSFIIALVAVAAIALGIGAYSVIFKEEVPKEIDSEQLDASLLEVYTINYDINTAESISSDSGNCLATEGTCTVTTPEIVAKDGYKVIGWSTKSTDTEKMYDVNENININGNMTLYAITAEIIDGSANLEVGNICSSKKIITGVKVVDIAATQIGYIEKASDESLDNCTSNQGDNNYNKYGNSGNAWAEAFVNWSFEKAGINLLEKGISDTDDSNEYINWAKLNNIWHTSKSSLQNGDIILTDTSIGIAYEDNGIWKMISGNQNNQVKLVEIPDFKGFISMKGIAY